MLTWRKRKRRWFSSAAKWMTWNKRFAGKPAFTANALGYRRGAIFATRYYAHQVAFLYMVGRWPHPETDHINRIRADNRFSNLREVTRSENQRNRRPARRAITGVRMHPHVPAALIDC